MKKLNNLKWFTLGVIVAALVALTVVPAIAASRQVQATLTYRDIKIVLDGNELVPKDVNGNIVEPFLIDGTTYLPLRAIAGALGLDVDWDGGTSTVTLESESYSPPAPNPSPSPPASPPSATSNDWQNAPDSTPVWTASRTSAIAHSTPTCSNMGNPIQSTKGEVIARGGRACQNCWTNIGG